ncbi:hypothetical protein OG205_16530 [Lentzea sp. NBC_00516]|uniref:hypothetical protein n=1 Tax=Lentzea sp. NBC_00516 TaxID=2903582 RepID=UPI002E80EA51|nr:hypothetical protein [Lentzea sp. NBC_00516]WUD28541.1 hypothetical protein OG205_16530 [Lentzea sp. NBC_00516]
MRTVSQPRADGRADEAVFDQMLPSSRPRARLELGSTAAMAARPWPDAEVVRFREFLEQCANKFDVTDHTTDVR